MLEYLTTPLLLSVGACIVAASTGGAFPPDRWYESLRKPGWNPPNWVFPVAWTILYVALGRAGWLLMVSPADGAWVAVAAWWAHMVLNASFSPVFFGLKNLRAAEIIAWALAVSAVGLASSAWLINVEAGLLLSTNAAWTLFAAVLGTAVRSMSIVRHS